MKGSTWHRPLLLLLLLGAVAGASAYWWREVDAMRRRSSVCSSPRSVANQLSLEPGQRRDLEIPLRPMEELSYKTRQEIYRIREAHVLRHRQLLAGSYFPSPAVFGGIEDGRPWWGILGLYVHGSGPRAIEGPAEESRFIANPFLLIGFSEVYIYRWLDPPPSARAFPPRPLKLVWFEGGERRVRVTYDIIAYYRGLRRLGVPASRNILTLTAYNARDMGLSHLRIVPERSKGVRFSVAAPIRIAHFLHRGPSCGVPRGCNNMSPTQKELDVEVPAVPATLWLELYRAAPRDPRAPGDLAYVIDMPYLRGQE